MKLKLAITLQVFAFSTFVLTTNLYAYKTDTHQLITGKAIQLSNKYQQFINDFQLDVEEESLYSGYGSFAEDESPRFVNHFYDPINERGLSIFLPAITWGYKSEGTISVFNNEFSWTKAREYLYIALSGKNANGETVAATADQRNKYFNLMFRSLGQVIHLVEDMAQPSHVRNDPHVSHSESEGLANLLNPSHLEDWARFHRGEVAAFTNLASGPISVVSFEHPFRTLSSFSNRNFFSDDTIFKNYPQPSPDETNYVDDFLLFGIGQAAQILAEDGQTYSVPYIVKTSGAFAGYKLAQVGYFGERLHLLPEYQYLAFQIDDDVAKENAQILIPQAVSYSAGLLDYFFRGQIDVTPTQGGLKIRNISTEAMLSGNISIYYDDITATRHLLSSYDLASALNPGDETSVIPLTSPADNLEPGQYIVVFVGQLGVEQGAVIGAVTPSPIYYVSKRAGVYKIFRMDTDGSNQEVVYDNANPNLTIGKLAPSPDGKTLAFAVEGPRIYLLDLTTNALSQLTEGDWPDWSPDGRKIVFQRDVTPPEAYLNGIQLWSQIEIFTRNLSTGSEVQLTNPSLSGNFVNRLPAFSPDGRTIAYTRWPPDKADCNDVISLVIYLMDTSGNSIGPLTCDPERPWMDEAPAWSPDGQEIAFTRRWARSLSG